MLRDLPPAAVVLLVALAVMVASFVMLIATVVKEVRRQDTAE